MQLPLNWALTLHLNCSLHSIARSVFLKHSSKAFDSTPLPRILQYFPMQICKLLNLSHCPPTSYSALFSTIFLDLPFIPIKVNYLMLFTHSPHFSSFRFRALVVSYIWNDLFTNSIIEPQNLFILSQLYLHVPSSQSFPWFCSVQGDTIKDSSLSLHSFFSSYLQPVLKLSSALDCELLKGNVWVWGTFSFQ